MPGKLKARAKEQIAKQKRHAKLTSGGPSSALQEDEAAAVASIIPNQINSLSNPFDDDNDEPGEAMHVSCNCTIHYVCKV